MLGPTAHKIAIYVAFALLSVWLVFMSLLIPQTIRSDHGGYTTTGEEGEKLLIDRRIADYNFALAVVTGVLAVSTVGLWIATAIGFRNQSQETKILQRAYITAKRRGIDVTEDGDVIGQLAFR
jgi:hypothetical protein